mmetsp:Transcript_1256/g.2921  ORF Transcript_1256/g.2921 Transcript_1256/m.2921 type:complete len:310 (+) Transcript_1256:180-1109(+)|eukprot:CAMPEP_0197575060 /NCGR_PEP_ID=MMETSP1326-20131121/588_1 /TAXON_ID=1155430 /ORGANISM="Genus nov. species nov., Strain RCC2288" /LENGTH=309 /DNA_ID=CAMNT_0043137759 /DNA_START=162 /DNA_END=1091 /DNA_ORIENTATION=-
MKKSFVFGRRKFSFVAFLVTCFLYAALRSNGGGETIPNSSSRSDSIELPSPFHDIVTRDTPATVPTNKLASASREDVYAAYHRARRLKCDGCRYVPFYKHLYSNVKNVFDAGAANCGVFRALSSLGYKVQGIEFSSWVVKNFCGEMYTTGAVEIGPIHRTRAPSNYFDLVLCTDVLEHIPMADIPDTIASLARLAKPGGKLFLVIASDPSKHENHPERSNAAAELQSSGLKIHETVKPRTWWLEQLEQNGLREDHEAMQRFLHVNHEEVHDPRYGFTLENFKGRGTTKQYEPNPRHVARVYCLVKTPDS